MTKSQRMNNLDNLTLSCETMDVEVFRNKTSEIIEAGKRILKRGNSTKNRSNASLKLSRLKWKFATRRKHRTRNLIF
jgi:hypothetical protein